MTGTDLTWLDPLRFRAEIEQDEGRRLRMYVDSLGNATIGVGHNLRAKPISDRACDVILDDDTQDAAAALDANAPWWRGLPPAQARVMLNLCFNMGWGDGAHGLSSFHHFLAAMEVHDWRTAVGELKTSTWWTQVGTRGPAMLERLLSAS